MRGTKTAADLSRREFIRLDGAGLAGAALLGSGTLAGCGGNSSGSGNLVFSMGPDETGSIQSLVDKFNEQSEELKVEYREMPADSGQYFDKLRTQFQAGSGGIDVIGGDVIWPAQFAANGWLLNLSDKFPERARADFFTRPPAVADLPFALRKIIRMCPKRFWKG